MSRARPRLQRRSYGFDFGPGTVARLFADTEGIGFEVRTKIDSVIFEISPAGIIEIWQRHRPRRRP